jgi:signal transduction histidine kinase
MGEMISMIAHQWRQPLNRLSYMLMNIEGAFEHGQLDAKYLRGKLTEAEGTLEYMSHTINDFRDFFRPDKARETLRVSHALEQTLGLLEKSFDAHGIDVEVQLDCDTELPLYRNELIQVFLNVITNAKDALVERRTASPRIGLFCYETGQFVVVRICDNAGGIDTAVAERIFEPYFSTKEKRQGTGLGLYMARTIVEEHFNGELTFENGEEGACFFIKIGRHQTPEARP